NVCCASGVDGEGQCGIVLTIVHAVKRGGIDDPLGIKLTNYPGDADPVCDIDIGMAEPQCIIAKLLHQVLPELTGSANDQHLHEVAPAARVSLSQRMLKKRGSLSGSVPNSPRSRASQIVFTASPTPRSALKPMAFWILAPLT